MENLITFYSLQTRLMNQRKVPVYTDPSSASSPPCRTYSGSFDCAVQVQKYITHWFCSINPN